MCAHIHTMEYFQPSKKKKEILPFETTWMNLEGIVLSKIIQTQKGKKLHFIHVEYKKVKYIESREQNAGFQGQGGRGNVG